MCVCVCVSGGDVEPFQYVAHASSAAFIDREKINADFVRVVNETNLTRVSIPIVKLFGYVALDGIPVF